VVMVFAVGFGGLLLAGTEPVEASAEAGAAVASASGGAIYYAIAATMGIASMSAAYAVGKIGAAVMGAAGRREARGRKFTVRSLSAIWRSGRCPADPTIVPDTHNPGASAT